MNRFDRSFNDLDPETGRPFSGGHPDGVWMIAIVYSLIIASTTAQGLMAILALSRGGQVEAAEFLPFILASVLLAPTVLLLFARSKAAVAMMAAICLVVLADSIVIAFDLRGNGGLTLRSALRLAVPVISQGLVFSYTLGLKRDRLLS